MLKRKRNRLPQASMGLPLSEREPLDFSQLACENHGRKAVWKVTLHTGTRVISGLLLYNVQVAPFIPSAGFLKLFWSLGKYFRDVGKATDKSFLLCQRLWHSKFFCETSCNYSSEIELGFSHVTRNPCISAVFCSRAVREVDTVSQRVIL